MKKKCGFSKALAVLLALMMVFTAMPGAALGAEGSISKNSESIDKTVYVSFQSVSETTGAKQFDLRKQQLSISSDLAESYGYEDKIKAAENISVLDVLVGVIIKMKGADNLKDNLSVGSSGFVTVFGSQAFSFAVDGFFPSDGIATSYGYTGTSVNTTVVDNNQYVEMFMYDTSYSDDYSWFEIDGKRIDKLYVQKDQPVTMNLKGYMYMYNGPKPLNELKDFIRGLKGVSVITLGNNILNDIKTGDNGAVTLNFTETGNYIVSAQVSAAAGTNSGPKHTAECGHTIFSAEDFSDMDKYNAYEANPQNYCVFEMYSSYGSNEQAALESCECSCCEARLAELANAAGEDYSGKLIMPSLEVEVVESMTDEMEASNIAQKLAWDEISGENDIFYNVTTDLNLPTQFDGATVTWESSNVDCVGTDGKVAIPEAYSGNQYVVLTANVTKGSATVQRKYYLNIYESEPPVEILEDSAQDNIIKIFLNNFKTTTASGSELLYSDYFRDYVPATVKNGEQFDINQKNSVINRCLMDADKEIDSTVLGSLAKDALTLTALGVDVTNITVEGEKINLLSKIYSAEKNNLTIYNAPYVLLAYRCSDKYKVPTGANLSENEVIDYILKNQITDSSSDKFGAWGYPGYETAGDTASVLLGLSKYVDYNTAAVKNEAVTNSIENAENYIKKSQPKDSNFGGANYNSYVILNDSIFNRNARLRTYGENYPDVIDALLNDRIVSGEDRNWIKGYQGTKDIYSTVDGYRALVAFKLFNETGNGNIYDFSDNKLEPLKVETMQKRLIGLFVKTPDKIDYKVGEQADYTGMEVTAKYNNGDTEMLADDAYEISGFDTSAAGTKTITVHASQTIGEEVINVASTFTIDVTDAAVTTPEKNTVTTSVKKSDGTVIASGTTVVEKGKTSVLDVFKTVLANAGLTATIKNGNYVSSIDGLSEFDKGGNSGWLYSVNGVTPPTTPSDQYILNGGETILWYYTEDYTKEPSIVNPQESQVTTSSASGSATTTTPTEVSISGAAATATVTADNAAELVQQAKENKSEEIVVQVTAAASKGAETIKVQLEAATVNNILKQTSAVVTVSTENGDVTLDQEILKQAVAECNGAAITLEVVKPKTVTTEQKEAAGENAQFLQLVFKSGDKVIHLFDKGQATVKVEIPAKLLDKKIAAVYVDDENKLEQLAGKSLTEGAKKFYEFATPHFSVFALVDADQAGLDATEEDANAKIINGVQNTTIKITKTSKGKGWIKINWKKSKGYKVDYYEVFRKTGKNGKFGKTAFYKTKKHGITGSYKNTKSLKKGKRYYYKVRGVRVIDGKKYYTKWSKTYYRIAK